MPYLSLRVFLFSILLFILPASVMAAEFRTMENERFIIRYSAGDAFIARELERKSMGIRGEIIGDIGIDFKDKTQVIISPTIERFQKDQPAGTWLPLWAAGVAYPERNLIIIRSPRSVKRGRIDVVEIFIHEFSHIAVGRALQGEDVPVWLSEGLAMYQSREWNFSRHAVLTRAVLTGGLIPLRVLTLSFPAEEGAAELAYAQSFIFISFIINKIGRDAFHQFIRNYARSGNLESSLRRATGMPIDELEDKWLAYLKLRTSWIPVIASATTLWFAASLIFVYGYFRKRRASRIKLRQWAEEEEKLETRTFLDS
ncbi:MAG: hypothetical protein JW943_11395 [Deltaproteobacteria bacterium]|nr:hypothetical protein [Deltaproteobacteria bacterium]